MYDQVSPAVFASTVLVVTVVTWLPVQPNDSERPDRSSVTFFTGPPVAVSCVMVCPCPAPSVILLSTPLARNR